MLPPSSPSSSSPIPLVGELVSPLTKIPRLSSGAAALPPPYSSSSKRVALMSEKQKKRRSSVSSLSSDGDLSMLASPIAYIPTRRGLDKRLDEDDISCSGYTSASSLYDDNRRIGGEKRMSSRGGGGGMVEKENLRAQANECIDLSKRLAVEKERREKAESLVRQLKGQMREFKGSKMSADEKDKRIDKLLRRLSLLAAELEESKVHIKEVNTVHENTKAEVNEIKQASVKERAQHAQAMADLRHASAKKITELAEEKRRLEDAVAGEEGRKIELSKYRERMVAMEIVIESLTEEGKEREKDNEELMEKIEGMRGQLDALERIKEHEIEDVKSKEAKRTRDLLERIEYIEKELKDSRIQHKKHEDNVKVDRDKFNEVKEELERVNAEAISLRHSMEVAERAKQAVEERYEKLKVAEAKRLGEMSSLRLELVEVREALVIAKTRADSLAREIEERADDDNDNDDAIPSIELIINEEDEVAIITKDHIESSSPPPPHTYRAFDSPAATAADVYSTPGGLVGSSSVKRRRRRLRRVSAPLLDAATLSHQPHARMGLVEDLKGQVSNLTTQLIESIGKLRRSEEELDKINVMFKSMEIELNEEKDKVEDMKAEVNARAREILISSGRAAVAESMLREIGEERQREKLTLLSEIASLRSSLLQNEATAARTAASVKAGLQEANEKVHMLETRLSMQQNSISAMSEQCNRWRIQAEQVESQLIGRELEATSLRASLEEAKARAIELSDDLATAGDSLVNMEANTLDLQFKLSYYESLYTQNEAAVIVAKACVGGVTRAMTIESQRREANLISLSEAKVCKATQHAEELRGVLKATENERKDLEKALIILRREAEERELLVAEKIAKLEEMNKDLKVKMKTVEDHLVEAQERLINNDTEIEILKTTGLSAEQRQSLEKEIEEANKTMRDTLDDLSSTRADLETATKEVTRCHKIIEHFDMEVINAGGHDRSSGGTGSHLSQSKRVSYVQHLRIELNNLYEENKRLRNERQNLETQLLMGARRPSTAPARPSPTTNSSATPRRTPCKGPVPPRTPKTPMGMAAAELARRKTFTSRKFSSTVQQPFYGKREAEEIKLNERQRQRLLSERVVLLGRIRGVLEKSNASRESLRTLLESIHDSLASRDGGEMDSQVIHQTKL